jgi:hypothetical protein
MAVATWEDVAVALGRPTSDFTADQQAQLTYWLNGVELFIKNRLGVIADLDEEGAAVDRGWREQRDRRDPGRFHHAEVREGRRLRHH